MVLKQCASRESEERIDPMEESSSSSVVLKACASRTTTGEDVSKLEDPMEISYQKKRKAEFDAVEEEEKEEEEFEDEETKAKRLEAFRIEQIELHKAIKEPPEWDVDSFEDLKYYSSPEEVALSDDDEEILSKLEGWNKDYRTAKKYLIESKGFYTDPELSPNWNYKGIHPADAKANPGGGETYGECWEDMVHLCLEKYNQDKTKVKDGSVEFVELVRGNFCGGPRSQSYITFMAREKPDGPLVEYQAKCMITVDGKRHPVLCRPAPPKTI